MEQTQNPLTTILGSASKIVLLLMALALVGLVAVKIVDPKTFDMALGMVLGYYFGASKPSGTA